MNSFAPIRLLRAFIIICLSPSISGCLTSKSPIELGTPSAPIESGTYVNDDGQFSIVTRSDETPDTKTQLPVRYSTRGAAVSLFHLGGCDYATLIDLDGIYGYGLIRACKSDAFDFVGLSCKFLYEHQLTDATDKPGTECLADQPDKLAAALHTAAAQIRGFDAHQFDDWAKAGHLSVIHAKRMGDVADFKEFARIKNQADVAKLGSSEAKEFASAVGDAQKLRDYVDNCDICDHAADAVRLIKSYGLTSANERKLAAEEVSAPSPFGDKTFFSLEACNPRGAPVYVAVASAIDPIAKVLMVRGWWEVPEGCKVITQMPRGTFYVFATRPNDRSWGHEPSRRICAARKTFSRVVSSGTCLKDEQALEFAQWEMFDGGKYTITFPGK